MGGLVDDVQTYYAQGSNEKQLIKHILLLQTLENDKLQIIKWTH